MLLKMMKFFNRWILRPILFFPILIFFPTRIINKKELRKYRGKGVVICCNHRSNTDAILIYVRFWRKKNFFSKQSLFKTPFRNLFFRGLDCYPVERGKEIGLIKFALQQIKKNRAMMMFPEGQRVFNPEDALALRNGAAMMAIKGGVPVVPMVFKRPPRPFKFNAIKIGDSIPVDEYLGKKMEKSDMLDLSGKIQVAMAGLLENFEIKPKPKWWELEPAVAARGIVFVDDKLLLIKRNRGADDYYVIPGGHVDGDENPRDAVVRELKEECSVEVEVRRLLYRHKYAGSEWMHEGKPAGKGMQSFYLCEYKTGEVSKTDAEEYSENIDPIRGTYEPVLVAQEELANLNIQPAVLKKQLLKDVEKYTNRLARATKYLK